MAACAPGFTTKSNFADSVLRKSRAYVSALVKSGRAVTNEDGHIHVEETLRRIMETTGAPERAIVVSRGYSHNREERSFYEKENSRLDYEERCKTLMPAVDIVQAISKAATTVRARLESMPDQLAPQIAAAADEAQVRALLAEFIEAVLGDMAARFNSASVGVPRGS